VIYEDLSLHNFYRLVTAQSSLTEPFEHYLRGFPSHSCYKLDRWSDRLSAHDIAMSININNLKQVRDIR